MLNEGSYGGGTWGREVQIRRGYVGQGGTDTEGVCGAGR